jgi:hypothetical protein
MSANRNSLPQKTKPKTPQDAQAAGAPAFEPHMSSKKRAGAHRCCFASAFVPSSDESRDGGRAFPRQTPGKADSVSPVPARIALQGEERAGTVAIDIVPALREMRASSGTCLASLTSWPEPEPAAKLRRRLGLFAPPVNLHRKGPSRETLSTISRMPGGVNKLRPPGILSLLRARISPLLRLSALHLRQIRKPRPVPIPRTGNELAALCTSS